MVKDSMNSNQRGMFMILAILAMVILTFNSCGKKEETAKNEVNVKDVNSAPGLLRETVPPPVREDRHATQAMIDSTFDVISTGTYPGAGSDSGIYYQWSVTLKNKTSSPVSLKARLRWLDKGSKIVHQVIQRGMKLEAKEEKSFTGQAMIKGVP